MSNQASLGDISNEDEESESSERTILGEVPRGWNSDVVENLFSLTNGSAREDRSSSRNTSETEGEFDVYGANGKIAKYDESNLDKGLVIGRVGTVGSVYEIDQPVWVSDNAIKAKLGSENNLRFLYYVMKRGRLDSLANQTAQPLLNQGIVGSVRLPTPEKDEQRWIASVLYNVDRDIQKTEKIIEQTQRVKKGLMQDLFTEGYFNHEEFQDARIGPKEYRIPSGWTTEPIGDLGKVITGDTPSTDDEDNFGDKYPFVTPEDLKDNKYITDVRRGLTDQGMGETKEIPGNSVMMDCIGSDLGKVAISKRKLATNQQINSIVPGEEFDPEFLYYSLQFISEILKAQAGATATPIVRKSSFSALELFKPEKDEQEKIGSALKSLDDKTAQLREEKAQLQRLKKGLMQDLLTGEIRTNEKVEVLDEVIEVEG